MTLFNRVKQVTATTGTGTITLGAAVDGYQTYAAAGATDGQAVNYVIEDGAAWEYGTGTYSSGTLSRDNIEESSNSGAAIDLSGSAVVFCGAFAGDFDVGRDLLRTIDMSTPAEIVEIKDIALGYRAIYVEFHDVKINNDSFTMAEVSLSIDNGASYTGTFNGSVYYTPNFNVVTNTFNQSSFRFLAFSSGTENYRGVFGGFYISSNYIYGRNMIRIRDDGAPVPYTQGCEHDISAMPSAIKLTTSKSGVNYDGGKIRLYGVV